MSSWEETWRGIEDLALEPPQHLGLLDQGGLTRIEVLYVNTGMRSTPS